MGANQSDSAAASAETKSAAAGCKPDETAQQTAKLAEAKGAEQQKNRKKLTYQESFDIRSRAAGGVAGRVGGGGLGGALGPPGTRKTSGARKISGHSNSYNTVLQESDVETEDDECELEDECDESGSDQPRRDSTIRAAKKMNRGPAVITGGCGAPAYKSVCSVGGASGGGGSMKRSSGNTTGGGGGGDTSIFRSKIQHRYGWSNQYSEVVNEPGVAEATPPSTQTTPHTHTRATASTPNHSFDMEQKNLSRQGTVTEEEEESQIDSLTDIISNGPLFSEEEEGEEPATPTILEPDDPARKISIIQDTEKFQLATKKSAGKTVAKETIDVDDDSATPKVYLYLSFEDNMKRAKSIEVLNTENFKPELISPN